MATLCVAHLRLDCFSLMWVSFGGFFCCPFGPRVVPKGSTSMLLGPHWVLYDTPWDHLWYSLMSPGGLRVASGPHARGIYCASHNRRALYEQAPSGSFVVVVVVFLFVFVFVFAFVSLSPYSSLSSSSASSSSVSSPSSSSSVVVVSPWFLFGFLALYMKT